VDVPTVERAIQERGAGARPLFFLDLAVPRDVDPAVADLPGVGGLANVDDLGRSVQASDAHVIAQVRDIVAEETARFAVWRRSAVLSPLIQALHDKGERIRAQELARVHAKLADLSAGEREAVEAATKGIVAKLLHDPVVRTKHGEVSAAALGELFGLTPEGDQESTLPGP
jgi:glutamyl-tRNA reductase